jgi:acetyltransferase-like isoleucine patch superfamily enzyme
MNQIIIHKQDGKIAKTQTIEGLAIEFFGMESLVEVWEPYRFRNCKIILTDNNIVQINKTKHHISNLNVTKMSPYNKLLIGEDLSCSACRVIFHEESGLIVKIGDDCMFSGGIIIRPSDGHTIYNVDTKKAINAPSGGIIIGNHVWLGLEAKILKGANIADNTIVGMTAIVTKSFREQNTVLAGIPARVIKRGVNWDRRHTELYNKQFETPVQKNES